MKKIKTVYFVYFLILLNISSAFAGPKNVPSPENNVTNADGDLDPPPVGAIDDNILLLTIAALGLGSVVIYKNKIKKTSV